ncbi:MAG: protein kinase [Planctomycetota bacterium]|nr:protein kinase [Planctomycetota bacterium]
MVTATQVEEARRTQAASAQQGVSISLADALVHLKHITNAQREKIELEVKARQEGAWMLGQYKLLRKLGEGGMGTVYLAEDTIAGRQVALKLLAKKRAGDPEFLTRFRREAKAAGRLNHTNIVSAYTVGEEAGQQFIVMEYCDGESLDTILKREHFLPWDRALEIVMQVAHGLEHAHTHGLIHRDIKPANIVVTTEGVAKILDMGLSKNVGPGDQSFNTQTGTVLGTPHYISPEQASGDKDIDGRADIYSLGATFYHLLTGETPFQGPTGAVIMMKHLSEQLQNPQDINEDIPDGVAQVVTRMMAKDANDRYRDCKELLEDLELVLQGRMPGSQASGVGKSSVAMRVRAPGSTRATPPRRSGGLLQAVGPRQPGPVGARRRDPAVVPVTPPPSRDKVTGRRGTGKHEPAGSPGRQEPGRKPRRLKTSYLALGGVVFSVGVAALGFALSRQGGTSTTPDAARLAAAKAPDKKAEPPKAKTEDAKPAVPKVPEKKAEPPKTVMRMAGSINLLRMVSPQTAVNGTWALKDGALVSDRTYETSIRIPWQPPEEYDFHIEFTRLDGNDYVQQSMCVADRAFNWAISGTGNNNYAFQPVWGKGAYKTAAATAALENGRSYVSLVQVRKTGVKAFMDGTLVREYVIGEDQGLGRSLRSNEPTVLGLGTHGSPTAFRDIRALEVTGKGRSVELPWTKPATVDDAFVSAIDAMPPIEQFQRVFLRLQDFNPGLGGAQPTISAGSLTGLSLGARPIRNLAPLRALPWLANLSCCEGSRSTALWDLSPLKGMELQSADFANTNVADLSPLQGMRLQRLKVAGTPVTDISPLAGSPLTSFDCASTPLSNLTPLRGMALKALACNSTRVRDLSPLKGMLLTYLDCNNTPVSDIAPLEGMPLTVLRLGGTSVSDLVPLRGMPLTELNLGGTKVADISPLKGMPLSVLELRGTQVADFSPLRNLPLTALNLDFKPERDTGILGSIRTLATINGVNAADVLKKK